eukprot:5192560-Amphidinium_carterae.2
MVDQHRSAPQASDSASIKEPQGWVYWVGTSNFCRTSLMKGRDSKTTSVEHIGEMAQTSKADKP